HDYHQWGDGAYDFAVRFSVVRSSSGIPIGRRSSWGHDASRFSRVPVQAHRLESLHRLPDQSVVATGKPQRAKGERLKIRLRLRPCRRLFFDLSASRQGGERVKPRDESIDIPKASGAPLAEFPLDPSQVTSRDSDLDVHGVEHVAVPFHAQIFSATLEA